VQERDENTALADPGALPQPGDTSAVVDLLPGVRLAGRFLIKKRLGSGATGTVFSALDTTIGQMVAVKLLRPDLGSEISRERLRREVRAARPGHPNVVTVFDLHEDSGRVFLSMELVSGRSLRDELADRERLPWHEVVGIGRQVAAGLAHLHAKGLVHRDVKPGNILIATDGTATVCDMGLARPVGQGTTVTETAMVVGTPAYMAPEQARAGDLTAASDVYALGLTLYQTLTGSVPREGTTAIETLMLRQKARPPRIRSSKTPCPRWFDRLIRRMLEPEASDRPGAAEVGAAMERGGFSFSPSKRVVRKAAVVVVMVAAFGAAALGVWRRWSPETLVPTSPLRFVARQYADSTMVDLSDAAGTPLQSLDLGEKWNPVLRGSWGDRHVVFGDFNGDGLPDAAVAHAVGGEKHFVSLFERRADGRLSPVARHDVNLVFPYDGEAFTNFRITDLLAFDLDGDGSDELILVEASTPFYPAAVRVIDRHFETLFTLWHPGVLRCVQVGDRNRDGLKELYIGGTGNFSKITDPESNTSMPIFISVEADWTVRGQEISLFGDRRQLAASTPEGVGIHYLSWPRIVTENYHRAWQHAAVQAPKESGGENYLSLVVSSDSRPDVLKKTGILGGLREIFLNRSLKPTYMAWNPSFAEALRINPTDAAMQALLMPRYWNGRSWQAGECPVPTSEAISSR
jgi:tRNA A-37 threonylcarbamoyl transferase component Bud32